MAEENRGKQLTPDKVAELRRLYAVASDSENGAAYHKPLAWMICAEAVIDALPALLDRLEALEKVRERAAIYRHGVQNGYTMERAGRELDAALEETK